MIVWFPSQKIYTDYKVKLYFFLPFPFFSIFFFPFSVSPSLSPVALSPHSPFFFFFFSSYPSDNSPPFSFHFPQRRLPSLSRASLTRAPHFPFPLGAAHRTPLRPSHAFPKSVPLSSMAPLLRSMATRPPLSIIAPIWSPNRSGEHVLGPSLLPSLLLPLWLLNRPAQHLNWRWNPFCFSGNVLPYILTVWARRGLSSRADSVFFYGCNVFPFGFVFLWCFGTLVPFSTSEARPLPLPWSPLTCVPGLIGLVASLTLDFWPVTPATVLIPKFCQITRMGLRLVSDTPWAVFLLYHWLLAIFIGLFVAGTYVAFVSSGLLSGLACCALVSVIWLNCGVEFFVVGCCALDLCWFTVLLTELFPCTCGCAILLPCVLLLIILLLCVIWPITCWPCEPLLALVASVELCY
jgi:hypothetical protein